MALHGLPTEDGALARHALEYVIRLYHELTEENGAPSPGTQNQAVDFIMADPELRRAVAAWAATEQPDEASTAPPRMLPRDGLFATVSGYLAQITQRPVFLSPGQVGH